MPSPDLLMPPDDTVRGNMLLTGEDASLFGRLAAHLTAKNGKPVTTVAIIRDALRCYARHLGIIE